MTADSHHEKMWRRIRSRINRERHDMKGRLHKMRESRCAYCSARTPYSRLTFDHVMPLKWGALDVFENLVLACEPCNHEKGGSLPTLEFHEAIRLRIHDGRRAA